MASLTPQQRDVLVKTILGEARGEGEEGMAAVAHVIANRAGSGRYPGDPAAVALQDRQFSTWNRGEGGNNPNQFRPGTQQYDTAAQIIDRVFSGQSQDPTNGALFYHTPAVNPNWAGEVNRYGTTKLGNHIFYNGRPVPPRDIPNAGQVASQLDVRRPAVTGSPTPMPASMAAQRNLTGQLSQDQTTRPAAGFYNGIFPQPSSQGLPSSASINNTVRNTQAGQMPLLANSLEKYAQQQSERVPYSQGQTVATISTRPTAQTTTRTQQREDNGQSRPQTPPPSYSQGTTIATVPTRPALQQAAAPRMTPAQQRADNGQARPAATRAVPSSVVNQSVARAQAATSPALQVALANRVAAAAPAPVVAPRMTAAQQREDNGQTRPVRAAVPGPNAPPKDETRLTPQGPLPIAAPVARPATAPIMVTAARPAPAPVPVTGFPTPVSQRPLAPAQPPRMPIMAARPIAPVAQQPLRVVVQAQQPQPVVPAPNRYIVNGKAVQNGVSSALAGTAASGFGSDRYDRYSSSTSISG